MARFIFITGGVVSSLGKGLCAAALGSLLQARGFKVRLRKLDPYLNVDPGTMSPYQHGEVYVTDDGAETDLDLGHYERFTGVPARKSDNVTTGQIYSQVLARERRGEAVDLAVERIAAGGDPHAVPLPRPLVGSAEPHFSFAGLKSAVARAAASGAHTTSDLAASFQQAVVDCLVDRSRIALAACPDATAFVVAGGVAANGAIRTALTDLAARFDRPFVAPPLWLCTDNGAMIAWAGAERLAAGLTDPLDTAARPRWPLDPAAEAVRGAGVKA